MKIIRIILISALIYLSFYAHIHAEEIKAKTSDDQVVKFDADSQSWTPVENSKSNNKTNKSINTNELKLIETQNGEISLPELKSIYLSQSNDDEIKKIVDTIYAKSRKCNCTVCQWPSHCKWGNDCSYQRNVPCSWCCP